MSPTISSKEKSKEETVSQEGFEKNQKIAGI
jgi:hypothetical protein